VVGKICEEELQRNRRVETMSDFYFKRVKSKGVIYMSIWKHIPEDKDVYCCTLGNAETCYEKFVKYKDLVESDKQLRVIRDKLAASGDFKEKDKQPSNNLKPNVLEDENDT
jgi:hypothetical protein